MASAAKLDTISSTGENIFDEVSDGGRCTTFKVHVDATAANACLVNVPGLHKSAEFFPIPIGGTEYFRLYHGGITTVFAKGDGANTILNYGVVVRTRL